MTKKDIEGFLSNPFFRALKPKNDDIETVFSMLIKAYESAVNDDNESYKKVLNLYSHDDESVQFEKDFQNDYLMFVKQAMIEYCLQEEALQYFCLNEDYEKIVGLINRKQFNSKLLSSIFNKISCFCNNYYLDYLANRLYSDIKRLVDDFRNKYVIKELQPLKVIVDKVTSGVKSECYIKFKSIKSSYYISDDIDEYILKQYGFSLRGMDNYKLEEVLSLALVKDENFWDFKNRKTIVAFLELVKKFNGIKHVEKIIDYAFKKAREDEETEFLCSNKLPFQLYDLSDQMIKRCLSLITLSISKVKESISIPEKEGKGLIYPVYKGVDSEIQAGKDIFKRFLEKAYPTNSKDIFNIFSNIDTVIQDDRDSGNGYFRKRLTTHEALEYDLLGIDNTNEKTEYINKRYCDYNSSENILNRFYYRIYLIDKYSKPLSFECIYEHFYQEFKMIDYKFKYECSFVHDIVLRNENYLKLKSILTRYGFNISDSFKDLYIIALLDRKYATIDEANMFAELEQFGDAIYELAVDNIIFYDPDEKIELNHFEREKYVNADNQVKVSQHIGLDKAYISRLNDALNNKLDNYELSEAGLNSRNGGHYLADSLEMIIAVIAKEFGLQKSLEFATKIIVEANDELTMPVIYENFDFINMINDSNIDRSYLDKIYPGPFSFDYSEYRWQYHVIENSLIKLLKITIIGNETKEKRQFITKTPNFVQNKKTDKVYSGYQFVYVYLTKGLEQTIKQFTDIVKSSYIEEE